MRLPDWLRVVSWRRTERGIEETVEIDWTELCRRIDAYFEAHAPRPIRSRHAHPPAFDINAGQIGEFRAMPVDPSEFYVISAYLQSLGIFDGAPDRRTRISPDEAPGVLLEDVLNDIDKELGQ